MPFPKTAEIILAAMVVGVMLSGQILFAHPSIEYEKGVWVDEYLTLLIAGDPSPRHAMQALRAGMDGMPPLYSFTLRAAHLITGGNEIAVYRGCSSIAMWVALVATYASLRATVNMVTASTAVAILWSQPFIAHYALEARPYAMMLAGSACLAWGLRTAGWRGIILTCASSAFTSAIHYLGILPISIMLLAELLFGQGQFFARLRNVIPGAFGMAAFLPFLPLMIAQHRSIGPTWADPFSFHLAFTLLSEIFICLPFVLVLVAMWLSRRFELSDQRIDADGLRRLVPLFAMLSLPVVMMAYSTVGDSLMVDRYFIVALLGIPALLALPLAETDRRLKICLLVTLFAFSTENARENTRRLMSVQANFDEIARGAASNDLDLVFESPNDAIPLWYQHPELRPRMSVLLLPDSSIPSLPRMMAYQHRFETNGKRLYDLPPMWDPSAISRKHVPFRLFSNSYLLPHILRWTPITAVNQDQDRDLYIMTQ